MRGQVRLVTVCPECGPFATGRVEPWKCWPSIHLYKIYKHSIIHFRACIQYVYNLYSRLKDSIHCSTLIFVQHLAFNMLNEMLNEMLSSVCWPYSNYMYGTRAKI